jgi:hypothetical protein
MLAKMTFVAHYRAVADDGPRRHQADSATAPTRGAGSGALSGKDTLARPAIVRWSSWLLGSEIHVPPMSDMWLRTHEVDYNKHALDL